MRLLSGLRARWHRIWHEVLDPIGLDAFRQVLAYDLVLVTLTWYPDADERLTHAGYHPTPLADALNAPLVPLLPPEAVSPFFVIYFGAMLAVIFGRARRSATWLVVACLAYVGLADPISSTPVDRLHLLGFTVLALAPASAGDPPVSPAWPIRVLQATLLLGLVGSGLQHALGGDWWTADDVLWLHLHGADMTDVGAWMLRTLPGWFWPLLQHTVLGFQLLAPALLLLPRLRPLGFGLALGLHLVLALALAPMLQFSLQALAFYLLFVDPAVLRRSLGRLA